MVQMSRLGAACGNLVNVDVEDHRSPVAFQRHEPLDPRFFVRLAQRDGKDVGVAVRVPAELEPAAELPMPGEEHLILVRGEDPRRCGHVARRTAPLEAVAAFTDEPDHGERPLRIFRMALVVLREQLEERLPVHEREAFHTRSAPPATSAAPGTCRGITSVRSPHAAWPGRRTAVRLRARMEFALTEEQELLQETVRGFAAKECPPSRLRELFDAGEGHDAALWKGLGEMGITGLAVPEAFGGAGLEVLDLALVAEALGAGALPVPFLGHSLATLAITCGGSDAQRARWLPRLAVGERIASVALAEPGEAWDPDAWRLPLSAGRLTGTKRFVSHAHLADLLVVGTAGGGLALVEPATGGVSIERLDGLDRTRPLSHVSFQGAAAEPLPEGAAAARRVRDAGLVLLAADAFGGAWTLLEMTRSHVLVREQFGFPLAQFQAVKHQLASLATDLEPSRGLWWFAAHAQDRDRDHAERVSAIAKAHVTERAVDVGRGAVELHGGIGFTWECDVQFWFKRALFDRALLGSPIHHRERSARLAGW